MTTDAELLELCKKATRIVIYQGIYGSEIPVHSIQSLLTRLADLEKEVEGFRDELHDANDAYASAIREIHSLKDDKAKLSDGIESVWTLIEHSQGVQGLHLNGDIAYWGELLPGGQFQSWLYALVDALQITEARSQTT